MKTDQENVKPSEARFSSKLRFGCFEVDFESQDLRKDGRPIKLERKPFQLMEVLLRIPGRFVSRAELTRLLWPDLHVNFDRSLNTAVNSLRKALGDSPQNPSYIETRPGLGYRFIAPVQEVTAPVVHAGAAENCAKARYFLNKRTPADLHKAAAHLQAALHEDSRCVQAYADLAETNCLFALMNMAAPEEVAAQARSLAAAAVDFDPDCAAARASLGRTKMYFDWDWTGAAEEFQKAITLDGNSAAVHLAYGSLLSCIGNTTSALDELRLAQRLDPVCAVIHVETAWGCYLARDFTAAHEQCWKVLILEPAFAPAQHVLGLVHEQMKMYDESIIELENAQVSGDDQPSVLAALGHVWARSGNAEKANEVLCGLETLSARRYVSLYWNAIVCAGLGKNRDAIQWLEQAYSRRDVWLAWLAVDPRFDHLRSTPGFQSLLQRMNLAGAPTPKHDR